MREIPSLFGPRHPPRSGGRPRQLVILLHGYGASGDDLIGLAPHLARLLPDAEFVSPNAPERCEISPAGYQWYSLRDYDPGRMRSDPRYTREMLAQMWEGALGAAPVVDSFIDRELGRAGLGDDRLGLVGFSQGATMSLHVGPRRRACSAIVAFSGSLVGPERLAEEIASRPPILLVHGDRDELVPIQALFDAVGGLGAAELSAEWHVSRGAGHGIAPDGLELGARFLSEALLGRR